MENPHSLTDFTALVRHRDIERIVSPMIGLPSIVTPESILHVNVHAEHSLSTGVSTWDIQLCRGDRRIRLDTDDTTDEGTEYHYTVSLSILGVDNSKDFEYGLAARIPSDPQSGLYDLRVATDNKVFMQENAVQIIQSFPSQPTFCIVADPHLGFDGYPCINVPNIDEISLFTTTIQDINRIHPDFVVISGDLVDWSCRSNWQDFRNLLKLFQVPTFTLVGNHDYYWDNWWVGYPPMLPARVRSDRVALRHYLRHVNSFLRYTFDYGPLHAVCLDSGEDAELIKVAAFGSGLSDDDLLWLEDNLKDREHSFVFTHHPATRAGSKDELKRRYNIGCITKNRMQFMNLCSKYGVAAVFSGHEHVDEHWSEAGVAYYITPSATRSRDESGFRLVKLIPDGGYNTEVITGHARVLEQQNHPV